MATANSSFDSDDKRKTFLSQSKLPKLPVPPLENTCKRYIAALRGLQDDLEHAHTKSVVEEFLKTDGPRLQVKLNEWAATHDSYIEDFWYESYLGSSDPVVLSLNPFFVLEDDPSHDRGAQLPRAAALITSSLGFIHDLRTEQLEPDTIRGTPLDMDQYKRLFGTARIPTERGCRMASVDDTQHIVVLRRGQCYYFDVLDEQHRPLLSEREILSALRAIIADADKTDVHQVAARAVGVLSTENRKVWSKHRDLLQSDRDNAGSLRMVDDALFVVCLDDASPSTEPEVCDNFLCGTYKLSSDGVQIGTCTNRWYDKLQIIVCANGTAGINFEHTGVDGHTVLRFAADIFTDGLMLLVRSINPTAPTLFRAPKPSAKKNASAAAPKKLHWSLSSPELRAGIRFAETRLSDLICQNECQVLEFRGYGKNFITKHGFSPDAFVQMAFQAAFFGLYGRTECTYEPAMTKSFLHGRTEAIRTVQPASVHFTHTFFSEASSSEKVNALRKACEAHVKLTRDCSKGLGQDRHLYALYCLLQRERNGGNGDRNGTQSPVDKFPLPELFTDPGWSLLNTSILSTSNCGNPALRLFGFGPVAADGFGIGYIIKDDAVNVVATSKHLQTQRYLNTMRSYLLDVQKLIVQIYREANEPPAPFVDHTGILRDAKTGEAIHEHAKDIGEEDQGGLTGYSFFDSGEASLVDRRRRDERRAVGIRLPLAEY